MIHPINGHILIEPIKHDSFMASYRETYQEIGTIINAADDVVNHFYSENHEMKLLGNTAYFDSWLAVKYPVEGGKPDDFYWLVKWEDVRALGSPLYFDAKP